MRISELILEDHDTAEGVGWDTAKQGLKLVGKGALQGAPGALGKVTGAIGATAGGISGAWQAAKSGYQKGKAAVSGQPAPGSSASTNKGSTPTAASTPAAPTGTSSAATTAATPATATSAATGGAMKAASIVQDLDNVWSKITADQGSETSSPQVQQKIRAMARTAGMAGQTVESKNQNKSTVEFYSSFLKTKI